MHSNNEIGTIEPIEDIINIAKEREIIVHSDMVQSLGKVHLDLKKLKLDLASFSSHKLYGPKGIGCLFIRKGVNIIPLLFGGNQEINRRAGTENVPQIAAFAKAVEINCSEIESHSQHLRHLREYLLQKISNFTTGFIINGHPEKCLPNILSVSFESRLKQIDGEALLIGMDLRGVSVSSGSACTSGAMQPSKVLLAIGRDILTAKATIRFSFGKNTTTNDLDFALNALKDTLDAMNY